MSTAGRLMLALVRLFEGLILRPYLCPAGIWTIGLGSTYYADGRKVKPTDPPISEAAAVRLAERIIMGIYLPAAIKLCPTADTFARQAALGDFCFNLGPTRLAGSTLRKRVLEGDWEAACDELAKWNRGGGRVLPGLVRRRAAEIRKVRGLQ